LDRWNRQSDLGDGECRGQAQTDTERATAVAEDVEPVEDPQTGWDDGVADHQGGDR
jgi:hypothetical protein